MKYPILIILLLFSSRSEGAVLRNLWNSVVDWANGISSSVKSLTEEVEAWDCGADKFWITKLITQRAAMKRCKSVFEDINRACRYHDFCYSNGLDGQQECDDRFCQQLYSLKIPDPIEQEMCTLPLTMCNAVRAAGHLVYTSKILRKR